jgi:hypothetical protein
MPGKVRCNTFMRVILSETMNITCQKCGDNLYICQSCGKIVKQLCPITREIHEIKDAHGRYIIQKNQCYDCAIVNLNLLFHNDRVHEMVIYAMEKCIDIKMQTLSDSSHEELLEYIAKL